jgi:hypothetical protein
MRAGRACGEVVSEGGGVGIPHGLSEFIFPTKYDLSLCLLDLVIDNAGVYGWLDLQDGPAEIDAGSLAAKRKLDQDPQAGNSSPA